VTIPLECEKRDEPALYITTSTTLPVLTTALFAFTLAAMALQPRPLEPGRIDVAVSAFLADAAPMMLALGALGFLFATVSCLRAHAWDYSVMNETYIKMHNVCTDPEYQKTCLDEQKMWHARAVRGYRFGLGSALLGFASQVWSSSRSAASVVAIAAVYLLTGMAVDGYRQWQLAKIRARQR
jgi:hypothetical protein